MKKFVFILIVFFITLFTGPVVFAAPANSSFDDDIFYNVVVDAYNKQNNTSLSYDTNLTDEQLSTITTIKYSCRNSTSEEKIHSVKGIEKLTNLQNLDLESNKISKIDLKKNKNLLFLTLDDNDLTEIDVTENTKLVTLKLNEMVSIQSINVKNNTELILLYLNGSPIKNIDLSNNTKLQSLYLDGENLESIDLSHNIKLDRLILEPNSIKELDLSKNINLKQIDISSFFSDNNKIEKINISKCLKLEKLYIYNGQLETIDVSKNINLTNLTLSKNKLKKIDLSQNINLTYLNLEGNPFNSVFNINKGDFVIDNITLPSNSNKFYKEYDIDDSSVLSLQNNKLVGLKKGTTKIKTILKKASGSNDLELLYTVNVLDDNKIINNKQINNPNTADMNINKLLLILITLSGLVLFSIKKLKKLTR